MINVAIDGPAGAGKSTISKGAAKELGFIYVDTGALYRTIALSAVRNGIIDDKDAVIKMLESIDVKLGFENGTQCVYLNGEEVSAYIRTPEISMGASKVSAIPKVREFLLDLQRDIAKKNERDYNDSHRKIAPLKPSEESVIADTSELTLDESIALIVKIIKEHM